MLSYLRLGIINALPQGVVADKSALFGLLAFVSNANNYAESLTASINAGSGVTLTAAQTVAGVTRFTAASGGFNITLPSTSAIISALGPTIPTDGSYAEPISMMNDGTGQTGTLVAGDSSTTLTGTMTIATATRRLFLLTVNSATTITINNIGTVGL